MLNLGENSIFWKEYSVMCGLERVYWKLLFILHIDIYSKWKRINKTHKGLLSEKMFKINIAEYCVYSNYEHFKIQK